MDAAGKSSGRNPESSVFVDDSHDFSSPEATDDDREDSSSGGSDYSQCRSANFSSGRSWYHSPESEVLFGGSDLSAYLMDAGGSSGDAFVDALDECFDADKDRDFFLSPGDSGGAVLRATGLYDDDGEDSASVEKLSSIQSGGMDMDSKVDSCGGLYDDDAAGLENFSLIQEELCQGKSGGDVLDESGAASSSSSKELEVKVEAKDRIVRGTGMFEDGDDDSAGSGNLEELCEEPSKFGTESVEVLRLEHGKEAENFPSTENFRGEEAKFDGVFVTPNEVELREIDTSREEARHRQRSSGSSSDDHGTVIVLDRGEHELPQTEVSLSSSEAKVETLVVEKKKCVMRLGSKEAEDLLKLDVEEIVRPLRLSSMNEDSTDWSREHLGPDELSRYVEALDVRETYMDTVWDMEEVLLDIGHSSGNHLFWASKGGAANSPVKTRWTRSSTSVYDGLWKVDSVEVTGARQRRGGASLGERVVGVREHTIYRILVKSGENQWEIERRYREFVDLFQQLKGMFNAQTRVQLPSPWQKVTVESRKIFGNTSPDVVEFRSALLQVCLQSSLQAGVPISTAAPLLRFLFPSPGESRLPMLAVSPQVSPELASRDQNFLMQLKEVGSPRGRRSPERQDSSFGRTIRLVLQIHTRKPLNQELLNQRNLCAACYQPLSSSQDVVSGFIRSLGWGKPRFCEYTGQLYCVRCHLNETAILPAQVLRYWDFTPRVVSQLAKAYLDSIYDKPMLCVSAVNPFLYSKVPILSHVSELRRKLSRLVKCIHCPSRSRIQQLLGSRRYLLEQNDFYALRDLTDLSKGAFAVLPGLMQATVEKLTTHITRKCSVCVELGELCGAGMACASPQDLIYPFEDQNVHRCQLCNATYHRSCFSSIETCRVCTRDQSPVWRQKLGEEQASPTASSSSTTWQEETFKNDQMMLKQQQQQQPKRKLFSGLFSSSSSIEAERREKEKLEERRNSAIVNMSAILGGPIEL